MNNIEPIPVIVGPTASGKTEYAIRLALEIGAEIVSADSMQIYRYMDIGTAKAPPSERRGVPHHMIDVADPGTRFSVAEYQKMALQCIEDIIARGRRAIVAGGAGLYIAALVYNIQYPAFAPDPAYRDLLTKKARESGNAPLYAELTMLDPDAATKIHANDQKRIIRALEVYHSTGMAISEHERLSRSNPPRYRYELTGLSVERGELYRRIDARVDKMVEGGLVEEARMLYERYAQYGTARQAIGYKELFAYFEGGCALSGAIAKIKTETRRYAKRQMTWFRSMPEINWV